jgi:hypothetical protein
MRTGEVAAGCFMWIPACAGMTRRSRHPGGGFGAMFTDLDSHRIEVKTDAA